MINVDDSRSTSALSVTSSFLLKHSYRSIAKHPTFLRSHMSVITVGRHSPEPPHWDDTSKELIRALDPESSGVCGAKENPLRSVLWQIWTITVGAFTEQVEISPSIVLWLILCYKYSSCFSSQFSCTRSTTNGTRTALSEDRGRSSKDPCCETRYSTWQYVSSNNLSLTVNCS